MNAADTLTQGKLSNLGDHIVTREEVIMKPLLTFFAQSYNLNQLIPILEGTSRISLRVLDWFVTNYSKHYNVAYNIKKADSIRYFVVYAQYKNQLKAYGKKEFDPFSRSKRIFLEYDDNREIETTVRQLNFFRWAIENKVLDYVDNHFDIIVEDMKIRNNKTPQKELTVAANKCVTKHNVTVTVKFN